MKTRILSLALGLIFIGTNLFAGNGDLLVTGNVGIGTQLPWRSLHITNLSYGLPRIYLEGSAPAGGMPGIDFAFDATSTRRSLIRSIAIGALGTDLEFFTKPDSGTGVTSRMYISQNGNVGIGTTAPSYKLHVAGPIWADGGFPQLSDLQFKQNITPIDSPLSKILQIEGLAFNWKTEEFKDREFPEGRHYGMIADDVEKVLPEVVKEGINGEKGIKYAEIVPVLIEAIKELQKQIDQLKSVPQTSVK
jgi:hypothetical protein